MWVFWCLFFFLSSPSKHYFSAKQDWDFRCVCGLISQPTEALCPVHWTALIHGLRLQVLFMPCKFFTKENRKQCIKFNFISKRLWRASYVWNNAFYWLKDSEHIRYGITNRCTLSISFLPPLTNTPIAKFYTWIYTLLPSVNPLLSWLIIII